MSKKKDFELAPNVDEFYSTTPSSMDGLLVRAVGPRVDFAQIRQWVSKCRVFHGKECSQTYLPSDWSLIDLDTRDMEPYLIDVHLMCLAISTMGSSPPYVTLSYRWGDPERSTQCCQRNLATMTAPGGLMSKDVVLAPTIRDAIIFTKEVGFRYLWVDALCIVQDDYERKATYLNLMGTVYAEAALVLAILEGNADMGIAGIGHDREIRDTINLPTRSLIKSTRRITGKEVFKNTTWVTRSWTFQEALSMCELAGGGITTSRNRHGAGYQITAKGAETRQIASPPFLVPTFMSLTGYACLVQSYNIRSLTMDMDALNTLAGVTGSLLTLFPNGFLQGIPQFFFEVSLLWQPPSQLRRRVCAPNAPALSSWSWAAWHGDLDLRAWSDSHLVHDQLLVVRNNRIVNWQKFRCVRTASGQTKEEWQPIQYTFHIPRSLFEDPFITNLPWAWHAHPDEEANGNVAGRYFTYDPDDRENHMADIKFRFPFAPFERLKNVNREASYSHMLKGRVQMASFTLDTGSLSDTTSECSRVVEDVYFADESSDRIGWIRLNLYDERRPAHGTKCELVAISEGVIDVRGRPSNSVTWLKMQWQALRTVP